jgi:hypothetical protein
MGETGRSDSLNVYSLLLAVIGAVDDAGETDLRRGAPARRDARWVRIGCRERPKGVFLEFKVGDKVIYPNHGVGVIEKIQSRVLSGEERTFYTLRILSTDSTVMIPVANTGTVGLRKVLSKKDIEDILGVLGPTRSRSTGTGRAGSRRTRIACAPGRSARSPTSSRADLPRPDQEPLLP